MYLYVHCMSYLKSWELRELCPSPSKPVPLRPSGGLGPVGKRSTPSSAKRAIPGTAWIVGQWNHQIRHVECKTIRFFLGSVRTGAIQFCLYPITHTHTHIYISIYVYIYTYMHACIHTYIHLHTMTLHYITLHDMTLHYITYITLHTLHYITLHYITLRNITKYTTTYHNIP